VGSQAPGLNFLSKALSQLPPLGDTKNQESVKKEDIKSLQCPLHSLLLSTSYGAGTVLGAGDRRIPALLEFKYQGDNFKVD
jgi:hypothetical protein